MDISLFDFDLPDERIALRPASPRDSARMLVVRADGTFEHAHVRDLPDYLKPPDVMVVNDTKVIPARLHGLRLRPAGPAKVEVFLHRRLSASAYSVLARPARKLAVGDILQFGDLSATVTAKGEDGEGEVNFALAGPALDEAIRRQGEMPLPPYIAGKRKADAQDRSDYQTAFARVEGSVAAPTAGLHFTPQLLQRLAEKGIAREAVTLEVGLGTFQPVRAADTVDHRMHSERADLDDDMAAHLNQARAKGGRILAVGTTSLRTLESACDENGRIHGFHGETDIFIAPGYRICAADMLLTNFHLPRSTLFMLVSAFSGLETIKRAYTEAIAAQYRFYSYGDACLLMRPI